MISPLAKKLQIKPGSRVVVSAAPKEFLAALGDLPEEATVAAHDKPPKGAAARADVGVYFARSAADVKAISASLPDAPAVLWFAYPKKSSGVKTDLSRDDGWGSLGAKGFVTVASIAIDAVWSGVRLRPGTAAEIEKHASLIHAMGVRASGPKAKKPAPKVPEDLVKAVAKSKAAKATFASLAPSHVREYATWIEDAKRPETRAARVSKAVEMLADGVRDRNAKYR